MRYIWRGGNMPIGAAAGFVLLGLTVLPIAGCSQSLAPPSAVQPPAATLSGSSIQVQGAVASAPSTDAASVAGVPVQPILAPDLPSAAPELASAAAVPAPAAAAVTSPAAPALALAAPAKPLPASQPKLAQGSPATVVASTGSPVLKGLGSSGMRGTTQTLNPVMMHALKEFQTASAAFPGFCRDWQRKLSERERDNLGHIKWAMRNGVETGTYVAYSSINSCTCKEANNGVAVGVLTYKEFDYTLTGKSIGEARHATPHATAVVPTREIFAYDKGKWFW